MNINAIGAIEHNRRENWPAQEVHVYVFFWGGATGFSGFSKPRVCGEAYNKGGAGLEKKAADSRNPLIW